MSKKKNTLKDLDEFLKQQAATLVSPTQLSEKIEESKPAQKVEAGQQPEQPQGEISVEQVLRNLHLLAEKEGQAFRRKLYDLIIQSLESQKQSLPEDKMLINTALYLKSGDQWKDVIRDYWRRKR